MQLLQTLKILPGSLIPRQAHGPVINRLQRQMRKVLPLLLQQEPQVKGSHNFHALQLFILRLNSAIVKRYPTSKLNTDHR